MEKIKFYITGEIKCLKINDINDLICFYANFLHNLLKVNDIHILLKCMYILRKLYIVLYCSIFT